MKGVLCLLVMLIASPMFADDCCSSGGIGPAFDDYENKPKRSVSGDPADDAPEFIREASAFNVLGDGDKLLRARLRLFLRMESNRAKDPATKAALQKTLNTPELFDSVLEGVLDERNSSAKGKFQDLLSWLIEHKAEILKMIMVIVSIFAEENKQAILEVTSGKPVFMLASYSHGKDEDCGCPKEAHSCTAEKGRCLARPVRRVGRVIHAAAKGLSYRVPSRPYIRLNHCGCDD